MKLIPEDDIIQTDEGLILKAELVFPGKYTEEPGAYVHADSAVAMLYIRAQDNDNDAMNILMELACNYSNKYAFNALFELGKMAKVNCKDYRYNFACYMFLAWKSSEVNKLKLLTLWAYPHFSYTEFDSLGVQLYSTTSDTEFIDKLTREMADIRAQGSLVRMRINEPKETFYEVDVMIDGKISTFRFLFEDDYFVGINRYYL